MNRREFLKHSMAVILGMGIPLALPRMGEAKSAPPEPEIHRPFLQFKEHEERKATETIVIHHTAMPRGKCSTAEEVHLFHRENNGWAGIGYHYFIRRDGLIEQGRWPSLVGAHSYLHNQDSVGICLAGDFRVELPTREQLESLFALTKWLCYKYGLDPMEKGRIVGHCQLNDTTCPGENLLSCLYALRYYCSS